jgi:acetoin utilization deacetylase AcuC-like enzyme
MLVLHDNDTLAHKTIELLGAKIIPALESPERITKILEALRVSRHNVYRVSIDSYTTQDTRDEMRRALLRDHDPGYVAHLVTAHQAWVTAGLITQEESILPECFQFSHRAQNQGLPPIKPKDIYALAGYYAFDMSTGIMKDTYRSVVASAHLAFCGVEIAAGADNDATTPSVSGVLHFSTREDPSPVCPAECQDVLALCRPPGHHCDTKRAGGYCYANNAVVAVSRFLQGQPGKRVAILDIDYHHGNGTQEYFYDRSDVLYVSIHGQDEYPYYTGTEHETGIGNGEGFNFNLPLPPKSSMDAYMSKLGIALSRIETFAPDFLILSLGFDTYRLDPLGGFDIDTEDYTVIASRIRQQLSGMPALILLEGGYVLDDLGKNLLAFLDGWEAVVS